MIKKLTVLLLFFTSYLLSEGINGRLKTQLPIFEKASADYVYNYNTISLDELVRELMHGNKDIRIVHVREFDNNDTITLFVRDKEGGVVKRESLKGVNESINEYDLYQSLISKDDVPLATLNIYYTESAVKKIELTPQEKELLAKNNTLKLIFEDTPPYVKLGVDVIEGIIPDIINLIAKNSGLNISKIASLSPEHSSELIDRDDAAGIGAATTTQSISTKKSADLLYSDSYLLGYLALYTPKNSEKTIESIKDLSGKKISMVRRSISLSDIIEKIPDIEIIFTDSAESAADLVIEGKVDFFLYSSIGLPSGKFDYASHLKIAKILKELPIDISIALDKKYEPYLPIVNKAIANISESAKNEILSKWLNVELSKQSVNIPPRLANWLARHNTLKVGVDSTWAPFEFVENNAHKGIIADILAILFKKLGLEGELTHTDSWDDLAYLLKAKEIDMISGIWEDSTKESMLFSDPYMSFDIMIITRDDADFISVISDLEHKTIGVVSGYYDIAELCARDKECDLAKLEIINYKNVSDALYALSNGECDAILENMAVANYYMKKRGITNLKISAKTDYKVDLKIAAKEDMPELIEAFNIALASITEAERDEIYRKWISLEVAQKIDYRLIWQISIAALVLILIFMYWNRKLIIEIRKRQETEDQLRLAQQKALEASNAKSEFLANMSHEIRTPMNAIIGMNTLALKTIPQGSEAHDFVKKSLNSAKMLLRIINDILDFSKIEAGKLEIEEIPFEIGHLFSQINDLFSFSAASKGIEFRLDIDKNIPPYLRGDTLRIMQVITNLISNAIKFTDKGSVTLKIDLLAQNQESSVIRCSVVDSGKGIAKDKIDSLFTSFSQENKEISRKYGGTGLGLAISKHLVEMMGGKIWCESIEGVGSKFSFELSLDKCNAEDLKTKYGTYSIQRSRIMVVDDDETTLEIIKDALEHFSFELVLEAYATSALLNIKNDKDGFDLILIDYRLGSTNGFDLLRKIRSLKGLPKTPKAVLISMHDMNNLKEEAKELGFDGFIPKPLNQSTLLDGIMGAISKSSQNEEDLEHIQSIKLEESRVLLVEDNDINKEVAINFLKNMVGSIETATNGKEALDLINGNDPSYYDAILLDIHMPVMDGYEAARKIRKEKKYKRLPIIAMTANAMKSDVQKCLASGMNDHIPKPFEVDELYHKLRYWIQKDSGDKKSRQKKEDNIKEESLCAIDKESALIRLMDDTELYKKILTMFLDSRSEDMKLIKSALKNSQKEEALRVAHSLKGIANSIGAKKLGVLSATLEAKIKNDEKPDDALEETKDELESVIEEAKKIIKEV